MAGLEQDGVIGLLDSLRGKVAAAVGMAACCGLSMAIVLGLVTLSSFWLISGVAVAAGIACVAIMVVAGHSHRRHRHVHAGTADRPVRSHR